MKQEQKTRILNFGSINIDHVYQVDHFVRPGETLPGLSYRRFAGGKGSNQSIALARAGARVHHAGRVGGDGAWVIDMLREAGVDTENVEVIDGPSGHAVIQVNPSGENAIIIHGGANREITERDARRVLSGFSDGDYLLLQNEISSMPEIMKIGAERGLKIVFNPAPMTADVPSCPLSLVGMFIINEVEGEELTGEREPDKIVGAMLDAWPRAATALTLGSRGVMYGDSERRLSVPAPKVSAVDTTAAGDTFIGYLLAGIVAGHGIEAALETACRAAAVCVTRPGAADSIPARDEL
jgi:ribokinase